LGLNVMVQLVLLLSLFLTPSPEPRHHRLFLLK